MGMIKVTAKGNLGIHPVHGEIVENREYDIDENDFGDQLFHRPEGWVPPWERTAEQASDPAAGAADIKKARK